MADYDAYTRYLRVLIEHIRADQYPSSTQMDMLEAAMPAELLGPYAEVLLEKVEQERFPSVSMLQRIERIAARGV